MSTLNTTCNALTGGIDALDGRGAEYALAFSGTWGIGDEVTLTLTNSLTGLQTQVGSGNASGIAPNYCFTFNQKVYTLAGSATYFSAVNLPTTFNDPNAAGNGYLNMADYFAVQGALTGMAPYQGKLVFCTNACVFIWQVDPDPANWIKTQTLPNVGTMAPLSIQPVGDMDIYMLYSSGVRSIRVRDASNNAIIADIGTPIDALIQSVLVTLSDAQKATACGIVEPSANRYWLYIPTAADNPANGVTGKIYVFSYFPSSQVAAWSTYDPTYQTPVSAPGANYPSSGPATLTYTGLTVGGQYAWTPGVHEKSITNGSQVFTKGIVFTATGSTAVVTGASGSAVFTGTLNLVNWFAPSKFELYNSQVYARSGDNLFQYGGTGNNIYENCGVAAITPYIDSGLPGNWKTYSGIESAFQGYWQIGVSADYVANNFRPVYQNTLSTFNYQSIPYDGRGTHYAFQCNEYGIGYARLSSLLMHIANPPQGYEK